MLYSVFTIGVLRRCFSIPRRFSGGNKQEYNDYMSPRHFSKMYQYKSQHRHDRQSDWDSFQSDMTVLTGMLYTIAKWPIKPFLPAFYKTEAEYKKDYEPLYNPPNKE